MLDCGAYWYMKTLINNNNNDNCNFRSAILLCSVVLHSALYWLGWILIVALLVGRLLRFPPQHASLRNCMCWSKYVHKFATFANAVHFQIRCISDAQFAWEDQKFWPLRICLGFAKKVEFFEPSSPYLIFSQNRQAADILQFVYQPICQNQHTHTHPLSVGTLTHTHTLSVGICHRHLQNMYFI